MKKLFNLISKALVLSLVLIFTNCQKEEEEIIIQNDTSELNIQRGKLSDFINLDDFVRSDIKEYKDNKALINRTTTEDAYDFTILDEDIISVEESNQTTYTLKIVKDNQEENSFSNLVIKFSDEAPMAKIINYYPSQEYLDNIEDNSGLSFVGQVNMEDVDYDGSLDYLFRVTCTTFNIPVCTLDGSINPYGSACDNNQTPHYQEFPITVCYNINELPSFQDDDGPSSGDAGTGVSGGGNNGTTIPNNVSQCRQQQVLNSNDGGLVNDDGCNTTPDIITITNCIGTSDDLNLLSIEVTQGIANFINVNGCSEENSQTVIKLKNYLIEGLITPKELDLTLSTLSNDTPWILNSGFYNGLASLEYYETRTTISNGRLHYQYKLVGSDDIISRSSYPPVGGSSELVDVLFYFNQTTQLWYDFQLPSSYSPLTLDFLWDEFWVVTRTVVRYTTPFEDWLILIDGRDLEGVEQSRAVAGAFILVDIIPGSSALKALKLVKYGDEAIELAEAVVKYVDDIYKSQKEIVKEVLDGLVALFNNKRKGNFGEMLTDTDLFSKGYEHLHQRLDDIDTPLSSGIDGVFKNPETGEFIIVESKYRTDITSPNQSLLSSTNDGVQMSDSWITGSVTGNDRLVGEVGLELANEIYLEGYTRVLARIDPDGTLRYFTMDEFGVVGEAWNP